MLEKDQSPSARDSIVVSRAITKEIKGDFLNKTSSLLDKSNLLLNPLDIGSNEEKTLKL